jgi:predicted negative regulator of RcsB-dependent stress response
MYVVDVRSSPKRYFSRANIIGLIIGVLVAVLLNIAYTTYRSHVHSNLSTNTSNAQSMHAAAVSKPPTHSEQIAPPVELKSGP